MQGFSQRATTRTPLPSSLGDLKPTHTHIAIRCLEAHTGASARKDSHLCLQLPKDAVVPGTSRGRMMDDGTKISGKKCVAPEKQACSCNTRIIATSLLTVSLFNFLPLARGSCEEEVWKRFQGRDAPFGLKAFQKQNRYNTSPFTIAGLSGFIYTTDLKSDWATRCQSFGLGWGLNLRLAFL